MKFYMLLIFVGVLMLLVVCNLFYDGFGLSDVDVVVCCVFEVENYGGLNVLFGQLLFVLVDVVLVKFDGDCKKFGDCMYLCDVVVMWCNVDYLLLCVNLIFVKVVDGLWQMLGVDVVFVMGIVKLLIDYIGKVWFGNVVSGVLVLE